jgi:predicted S18 family serine protease|tara:strand:+ start:340 stop:531 length:192 start_codon:yes stop_codon:yes gene_type:complete
MSKKETKDYKKMVEKPEKPTNEEALSNLRQNLEDYTKQAKYYSNMALKAQGAIEVLEQLSEGE